MTAKSEQSVLILGASLAGLTAAYNLRRLGYGVTILDHQSWRNDLLSHPPNVPTYLLGCHQETLNLLRSLDARGSAHVDATLSLEFRLPDARIAAYRRSCLPSPLHWIVSLFRFTGLAWNDRWNLFSYLERVWERALIIPSDLDNRVANEWLTSIGQSQNAREEIWQPLARWLTGNPLTRLSAATFVQSLSRLFLGRASNAQLTQLRGSLDDNLITPLRTALQRLGAEIRLQTDVPLLRFEHNRIIGVQLRDGSLLQTDWYVAAVPHRQFASLLPERLLTHFAYFSQIGELTGLTEVAVQFRYRPTTRTPRLILLSGHPFHQLSLASHGSQDISCRLSATDNPSLSGLNDTEVMEVGKQSFRLVFPDITADAIRSIEVTRREDAALSLQPGAAMLRPIQKSPIPNLLVVGAWTDTGWPANMESAVVSARHCVEIIAGSRT